jgi:hypothetical protein
LLKENLKDEIRVLESMIQAFRGLEGAVLNRQTDMIAKYALSVEELSLEISTIELQRQDILKNLGYANIKEYIEQNRYSNENASAEDTAQIAYLAAEIVEKLNELTIVMDGIRQVIEFENHYFELLNHLVRGTNPASNYSFGQNKQAISSYTTNYDNPIYDRLK